PDVVVDPTLDAAQLDEQPEEGVVGGEVVGLDLPHEVEVEERGPQRPGGGGVEREGVVDADGARGQVLLAPALLATQDGVAARLTRGVPDDGDALALGAAARGGPVDEVRGPQLRGVPGDPPGPHDGTVDTLDDL